MRERKLSPKVFHLFGFALRYKKQNANGSENMQKIEASYTSPYDFGTPLSRFQVTFYSQSLYRKVFVTNFYG